MKPLKDKEETIKIGYGNKVKMCYSKDIKERILAFETELESKVNKLFNILCELPDLDLQKKELIEKKLKLILRIIEEHKEIFGDFNK